EQKPLILFAFASYSNEGPFALGFLAIQDQMQPAFAKRFKRVLAIHIIFALIPQHDGAAAVLAFGNYAFERGVVDRMIFHFDSQMFFSLAPWQSFGDGP